ncbi:MAG TPA: hypothetical protein VM031_00045 [Phycisphaerae bacterium]|nr:hypothetical protein [Phycisphaerae bacterium]
MRNLATALAVMSLAVAAAAGPLAKPRKKVHKGKVPTFKSGTYTLRLEKLEAQSTVELAERGDRKHSLKLAGEIASPKDDDAVALTGELKVLEITDAKKENLRRLKKPGTAGGIRPLSRYRVNTYVAFLNGVGKVAVPQTSLRKSAYTVETLTLGATVLLAKQRESKELPAVVTETLAEIVPGVLLRIMALKITDRRELTVVAKYKRPKAGPVGPFVESLAVLDETGKVIAQGRWSQGDPFGATGTLTAKVPVPRGKTHKDIRFVACTKYARKPLKFEVTGIFRR